MLRTHRSTGEFGHTIDHELQRVGVERAQKPPNRARRAHVCPSAGRSSHVLDPPSPTSRSVAVLRASSLATTRRRAYARRRSMNLPRLPILVDIIYSIECEDCGEQLVAPKLPAATESREVAVVCIDCQTEWILIYDGRGQCIDYRRADP
jgi:hypothetical protein